MNISTHFTLDQLCVADKQRLTRLGLRTNWPGKGEQDRLTELANTLLEPIWDKYPGIAVSSGYRSIAYNTDLKGSASSQHCKGEAADFEVPGISNAHLFAWIVLESGLKWGQLILEFPGKEPADGWVHISLPSKTNSMKIMKATVVRVGKDYETHYEILNPATIRAKYT